MTDKLAPIIVGATYQQRIEARDRKRYPWQPEFEQRYRLASITEDGQSAELEPIVTNGHRPRAITVRLSSLVKDWFRAD